MPGALNAVWGSGPDDAWAVGSSGITVHWNGSTWSEVDSGTSNYIYAIHGAPGGRILAVGQCGTVRGCEL